MKILLIVIIMLLISSIIFSTELVIEFQKVPETSYVFIKDRMFLHAVTLAETINAEYEWDNNEKSLSVSLNDHTIKFTKDNKSVLLDNQLIEMSEVPILLENRFFLPILDCCKLFGLRVVVNEKMIQIFTSPTQFTYKYSVDGGIGLKFDKRFSYVIKKKIDEMIELEIYGADLEEEVYEIFPESNKIESIKMEMSSENSLVKYLNIKIYFNKYIKVSPVLENNNTIWLKPDDINYERNGKKVVVIDPGHGGFDVGCIGQNKTYEKDVVLKLSNELRKILEANNYVVFMTRETDNYIDLKERAIYSNYLEADLFLSVHMNSTSVDPEYADGMEIFYYEWSETNYATNLSNIYSADQLTDSFFQNKSENKIIMVERSKEIANEIKEIAEINNIRFRKIAEETFDIIVYTDMPSILIECNFLSNSKIEESFKTEKTLEEYSNIFFQGIENYFWN